jgi:acetylornithine deacetylase/succinyl-diaminopimelate desuccinylase-like protein
VTGYALPDCNAHAPNERMALDHMALGVAAARETLIAWGDL